MFKNWLAAGAAALTMSVTATASYAAFVTQPGEQVGLASGAPLPEGVYGVNTFSIGRADARNSADVGVNIPVLVYSSPWKIFGARIEPVVAIPSVFVWTRNPPGVPDRDISILYNPFVGSFFAWDLGNNVGFSYLVGAYLPFGDRGSAGVGLGGTPLLPQLASTTLRQGFAISYTGDGWNLTANLTYNIWVDEVARFGGPVGAAIGPIGNADHVYLDLTATKKFGKFEIGAVAFGYYDLPVNRANPVYTNYVRDGHFAVGGLVGYDFGPFTAQVYVTRQIVNASPLRRQEETRGWFRVIAPLYSVAAAPPPPLAPVVRKY